MIDYDGLCCFFFRICIELHVLTSDASATEDGVVEAVRTELDSQKHKGLSIGHVGDFNTGLFLHFSACWQLTNTDTYTLGQISANNYYFSSSP